MKSSTAPRILTVVAVLTMIAAGIGFVVTLILNACTSSKMSLATKLEDFTLPQFDFMATADAVGQVGYMYMDE